LFYIRNKAKCMVAIFGHNDLFLATQGFTTEDRPLLYISTQQTLFRCYIDSYMTHIAKQLHCVYVKRYFTNIASWLCGTIYPAR